MTHSSIDLLVPELKERVKELLSALEEAKFPVVITETLRDTEVQQAYYAQGRKSLNEVNELRAKAGLYLLTSETENRIITECDGVTHRSNHQSRDASGLGHAFDMVPAKQSKYGLVPDWNASESQWEKLGSIAEQHGIDWCYGGEGKHWEWDKPHFELLKK